jgi:hypothetical protein
MPRHLKKTAVNPENGMPQTAQLASRGGVLISKGALIATHPAWFRRRVYVETDRLATEAVRPGLLADALLTNTFLPPIHKI